MLELSSKRNIRASTKELIALSAETKTYYRPGLQFRSPYSAYQVICRPYTPLRTPQGDVYDEIRELLAEFAIHGAEYQYETAEGTTEIAADIRGNFFDLDSQAEQKGWDDEEKEIVARKFLREIIVKYPGQCQLVEAIKPVAPWATYDDCHHNRIPALAQELGCLPQALAYEKSSKNREGVVAKLAELIALKDVEQVEELTAA